MEYANHLPPPGNNRVKAIVIDDEEEACENLKNIIEEYSHTVSLEIVGAANNTSDAELLIQELNPDVVFLDIDMPGENAFQFLERIDRPAFEIIFVTAYDQFALKALRANALDYILKPISIAEIDTAIQKLELKIREKQLFAETVSFSQLSREISGKKEPECIKLRTYNTLEIVDFKDVLYLEAQGAYSKFFYYRNGVVKYTTMSHSIAEYEEVLPADFFYRVHKSFLVNCLHIESCSLEQIATCEMILSSGAHVPVSRRRCAGAIAFLSSKEFRAIKL